MMLLRIYALTAIVLAIKMASIAIVQGRARTGAGAFLNPEDAATFGGTTVRDEPEMVQRASRAWRNDSGEHSDLPHSCLDLRGRRSVGHRLRDLLHRVHGGPDCPHHLLHQFNPALADGLIHTRRDRYAGIDHPSVYRRGDLRRELRGPRRFAARVYDVGSGAFIWGARPPAICDAPGPTIPTRYR